MLLVIDIGNTSTVFAFYENETLVKSLRTKTGDYDEKAMKNIPYSIEAAAASSVVPEVNSQISEIIYSVFGCQVKFIDGLKDCGLSICTDYPERVGADIICGAAAAFSKYNSAVIVFDLGTATTVCAVDSSGRYLGHSISPGIKTSFSALHHYTALLPEITDDFVCEEVIGKNTVSSMKSGVLLGAACFIDGMSLRYKEAIGGEAVVVVTGGMAAEVLSYCREKCIYHENLLLEGIRVIYNRGL